MGIQGLTKLLSDYAPGCVHERPFDSYFGRKIAVDASNHIHAFLVVVGRVGDQLLSNEAGQTTSHLQGMFYRTAKMLEAGIQPVFVFDGRSPDLKKATRIQRGDKRDVAADSLQEAKDAGDTEAIAKFSKRTIQVTKEMNDECKKLLTLLGVPIVQAPSEAEAQCSAMAKSGVVYAVATEDMDALTFGAPRLLRHLTASTALTTAAEYELDKALEGLNLSMDQFIDLCILCGCDYASNIRGIGHVRAVQLMQKHGSLEAVLESLDPVKYPLPDPFPYKEARAFFQNPEVTPSEQLPEFKWNMPDEEGLVEFLVKEKKFSEERVRKAIKRAMGNKSKAGQSRMESFFKVIPKAPTTPAAGKGHGLGAGIKRKEASGTGAKGAPPAAKKAKAGVGGGKKR